jgi:hypothetical protein
VVERLAGSGVEAKRAIVEKVYDEAYKLTLKFNEKAKNVGEHA